MKEELHVHHFKLYPNFISMLGCKILMFLP